MHQTQYQDISRFRREYSLDEILGETTVRLCQILSDSLFPSIFYKKKGATLYSTRRTKIMGDRSGKQTSAY